MSFAAHNPSRWRRVLITATAIALGLLAALAYGRVRHDRHVSPGAFLLATDAMSRAQTDRWWATRLLTCRAIGADRTIKIPANSTVKIVYADGHSESVVGPKRIQLSAASPPDELDYLRSPLPFVLVQAKLADNPAAHGITVTSPVGVTRFLNPTLLWTARDGATYNVAVHDPTEPQAPARIAERVRPPIALAQLATPQSHQLIADRIYEAIVVTADDNTVAGGTRFLTTADATSDATLPSTPADLLAEAAAAMAKTPTRTGDAWIALQHLPAEWHACELAVRLRLRIAAELGLSDEFTAAQTDARALGSHKP